LKYFEKYILKATQEEMAICMAGLLQGLKHLHQKRIAHRDIKPENIMLRDGAIKSPIIIDFGLATNCDM
jgi:serine/threonine protein kinase